MILLNNMYDVKSATASLPDARFVVQMRADSPIYRAHFPGMPITPGVCIVQMALELLSEAVGMNLKLASIKNAKFITPLIPDATDVEISYSKIKIDDRVVSAKAEVTNSDSTIYAKISFQADIA